MSEDCGIPGCSGALQERPKSARFDENGCFVGHEPRECGEHRTVGDHRAWCHDCGEWCYPRIPCLRCEIIPLRAFAEAHGYEEGDGLPLA